ncbi:hypothetical protein Ancab_040199 [Ancistrocladus abbreviatus]
MDSITHCALFVATSSINHRFLKSFLIISFKLCFNLPLPLIICILFTASHFRIGASNDLLFTCPNHLNHVSLIFSTIRATSTFSLISSLWEKQQN